jgi:hypothetical protein
MYVSITSPIKSSSRFTITNFLFSPFTMLGEPPAHPAPHGFKLVWDSTAIDVEIIPLSNYISSSIFLQQRRTVIPTADLVITPSIPKGGDWVFVVATAICRFLSVAAGTVVEWIVAESKNDVAMFRVHASRMAKHFCSLPIIPFREFTDDKNCESLASFLQSSIDHASKHPSESVNALVAAYLDARSEADFVQAKGIKLAVCLEMLKNFFVDQAQNEWDLSVSPELRKQFSKTIDAALKEQGIDDTVAQVVKSSLGHSLKRPSFPRTIRLMVRQLKLRMDDSAIDRVVEIRNKLVHTGRFPSSEKTTFSESDEYGQTVRQFFALLNFVDQLFLRLLGHADYYIDYSESTKRSIRPVIRDLPTEPQPVSS